MPVETKSITAMFRDVVRSHPYFRRWKKEGVRAFWNRAGKIHVGIAIVLFKGSFDNRQIAGLEVALGWPTSVMPILPDWGGKILRGMFTATSYVSPTEGMGEPTLGSNRAWILQDHQDLDRFRLSLPTILSDIVVPWIEKTSTENGFVNWYFKQHSMPSRLPIVLDVKGIEEARRELANWIASCPDPRPRDVVFEWSVANGLVDQKTSERLRNACMQARDTYCSRMQDLAREIFPKA